METSVLLQPVKEISNTAPIKQVEDPELEILWIQRALNKHNDVPHQKAIGSGDRDYVQIHVLKSGKSDIIEWLLDNDIWSFYFTPLFKEVCPRDTRRASFKAECLTKIHYYMIMYYIKGSWPDWVDDCCISHDMNVSCGGVKLKYTVSFTELYQLL